MQRICTHMISVLRLFSQDNLFFDLLEAAAQEAKTSVHALLIVIRTPGQLPTLEEFVALRKEDKKIRQRLAAELAKTFVTPIDREDIDALSHALYRIPKTVEKFAERMIIAGSQAATMDFSRHVILLEQATEIIMEMVKSLRHRPKIEVIRQQNQQLQKIEGDADKLLSELLREIYSGKYPPLQAMLLRDLYELLEKIIDRCRDAGNIIMQIALKHF